MAHDEASARVASIVESAERAAQGLRERAEGGPGQRRARAAAGERARGGERAYDERPRAERAAPRGGRHGPRAVARGGRAEGQADASQRAERRAQDRGRGTRGGAGSAARRERALTPLEGALGVAAQQRRAPAAGRAFGARSDDRTAGSGGAGQRAPLARPPSTRGE